MLTASDCLFMTPGVTEVSVYNKEDFLDCNTIKSCSLEDNTIGPLEGHHGPELLMHVKYGA